MVVSERYAKGFSFGETLLAAFVLSVGLLTVVVMFRSAITNSFSIRNATIATQLSQEGIELVRNVRDNDFANGNQGFTAFNSSRDHCYMDYTHTTLNCFATQSSTTRYYLANTGSAYVSSPSAQKFRRYIYMDYNSGNQEALVRSFVVWDGAALPPSSGATTNCSLKNRCVYTEALLTSWK